MAEIIKTITEDQPDDPRVNLELYLSVIEALKAAKQEAGPFNPLTAERDHKELIIKMREARMAAIENYNAKKMQQPPFRRGEGT